MLAKLLYKRDAIYSSTKCISLFPLKDNVLICYK